MTNSIGVRFIRRLKSVGYQVAKSAMERLRENDIHPQSGLNVNDRTVCGVDVKTAKGQANHSVVNPRLREVVDKYNASVAVPNLEIVRTGNLAAVNNNLVL